MPERHQHGRLTRDVVPADDKENARLIVCQIVADTLEGMDMRYPEVTSERELQSIRDGLAS